MRDDFAARIQHNAVAVENEFVICADQVDLREWNLFVARDAPEHFQTRAFLSVVPRRCGEVQDDFRALRDKFLDRIAAVNPLRPEILVVPDVLIQIVMPSLRPLNSNGAALLAGSKITVLIKNIISRQQGFCACAR